jgi:CheY-like chemotaxis protein
MTIPYTWIAVAVLCIVLVSWLAFWIGIHWRRKPEYRQANTHALNDKDSAESVTAMPAEMSDYDESESQNSLGWSSENVRENSRRSGEMPKSVRGQEKTIFIADDDPVVVFALSRRLQHLGYHVIHSPDATHALLDIKKVLPDLAILDLQMPTGNGLAVCEMLACDPRCVNIPVIVHSVFTEEAIRRRCRQLGVHYVQKSPQSWTEIKQLVDSLLRTKTTPAADVPPQTTAQPSADFLDDTESPLPTFQQELNRRSSLPIATSAPESNVAVSSTVLLEKKLPATATKSKPLTILCIDDDSVIIQSIALRLKPYGIKVKGADNGEQGYLSATTAPPSIILLDLKMPNGQGNVVLNKLKENPDTKDIPVVILTMESTTGVQHQILSLGADGFVTKPVYWPELFAQIGRYVQLPKQLIVDYHLSEQLASQEC